MFGTLLVGVYQALLSDVAQNCVVEGPNPRFFTVVKDTQIDVLFTIECSAP